MKKILGYDKLRGGYYTPKAIADFISRWAIHNPNDTILEPSCGDGSFIQSVKSVFQERGYTTAPRMIGVELDPVEAEKASSHGATIKNEDFFTYYTENILDKKSFDVVVGNPPFIRSQNFDEVYRKKAFSLMEKVGLHPNRLTNIWIPFLVLSTCALAPDGRLGMVIPAEVMQVDYAAEIRQYLSNAYDSLTIITFKKLLFPNAQQEVVLLLGEKTSSRKGIRTIEVMDAGSLAGLDIYDCAYEVKDLDHSTEKWTQYYLTGEEIALLRRLRSDNRIALATSLFDVNVGIVSGENDFFLLNAATKDQYGLGAESTIPIVGRAEQLKGINFSEADFNALAATERKMFLFAPKDVDYEQLTPEEKAYADYGSEAGYNKGYKCRIRKHWYVVPKTWRADAFMLRQVNKYPRIVYNATLAQNTDTLHKIRFKENVDGHCVAAAFLNSFTLAMCEIIGRSYGGGVLTFEPGEVRKLKVPMQGSDELDFELIDRLAKENRIAEILEYTDGILLEKHMKLTHEEILLLRGIWERLSERRIGRKKEK